MTAAYDTNKRKGARVDGCAPLCHSVSVALLLHDYNDVERFITVFM
jgi:hypothetical protein